ncbi:sialidase family protein [Saliphagus sp. LR7]|uniref:sialidase family protein n=1 Tax=Saliphagus sp. LR7 TaxID=2282654 RepID=UPI000DF7B494|nr:sialidase family protein [Saliphagus sp. LR7]
MIPLNRRLFIGAAAALGASGSATAKTSGPQNSGGQQSGQKGEKGWPQQGYQLPPQRLEDTDTYDNEPNITVLKNNKLLLIYRRSPTDGGGHVHNDGYIAARISNDWGESWSDEIVVADDADYDTRNQSVIYDQESGRVIVHYRLYDADTGGGHGEFYRTSENSGRRWSDPMEVNLEYIAEAPAINAPFGGYTHTSNGLMTQWYGFDEEGNYGVVEALFSTDGGQTWGNNVLVGDSTDVDGRVLTEPVPARYTDKKLWTFGRDNTTADMFAIQSEDGGMTWGDPVYFNPTNMEDPTPAWFKRTNANELTVIWGDRTNDAVHVIDASARMAWQDPALLEEEPVSKLAVQMSDIEADFGYVTFAKTGEDRRHTLVTFYDEDEAPNIWLMSLD